MICPSTGLLDVWKSLKNHLFQPILILVAPKSYGGEHRYQGLAKISKGILNFGWHYRINLPCHHFMVLKLFQLDIQYAAACIRNLALQLTRAQIPLVNKPQ